MHRAELRNPWLACLCLVAGLGAGLSARAQGDGRGIDVDRLGWVQAAVFDEGEGLPDPTVTAIATLPDGQVWIGTARGLARLSGGRLVAEPGPGGVLGEQVMDLASYDGGLWASIAGRGVFERDGDTWIPRGNPSPRWTQHVWRLHVVGDGKRSRLLAAGDGISEWDGQRWQPLLAAGVLPGDLFDAVLQPERRGARPALWVASFGRGLQRCDGGRCAPVAMDVPGPRSDEATSLVPGVAEDGTPALWVGFHGGGVARWAGGRWTRWHAGNSALPSDFVLKLALVPGVDGRPQLWAGTRRGVAMFDGTQWRSGDPREPLMHRRVRAIEPVRDAQGLPHAWLGVEGGALRVPLAPQWRLASTLGDGGNGAWAVRFERDPDGRERLWLGTDGDGLARYEDGQWHRYGSAEGLPIATIRSIARSPSGELWAGSWGARLWRLRGERFSEVATPWPKSEDEAVSILWSDPRDGAWVSLRRGGIAHWDGRRWTWPVPGAGDVRRGYDAERVGNDLWFSTVGNGLARLRDGEWRFFNAAQGLPDDALYDMSLIPDARGKPVLWIGSQNNGIVRIDVSDPEAPRWIREPALPAPPNPTAYGVVRDGVGDLIVCTNYGVARWRPRADGGYDAEDFHRVDGIPHDECNGNAMVADAHGRVWIGTVGGLGVYTPRAAGWTRKPAPLRIERVLVGGNPVPLLAGRGIRLTSPGDGLQLEFDLRSGEHEAGTRYRTQVLGLEPKPGPWVVANHRNFDRLPAGDWTLRIEAMDAAGTLSPPLSVPIVVPQAWWRTWPARLGLLALAATLLWLLFKWREEQARARERRLAAMVQERTAQLSNRERQLRAANDALTRLSYLDPLTGLANRRRLMEELDRRWQDARGDGDPLCLLLVDLDHFKRYNDHHGHLAGDDCLCRAAHALRDALDDEAHLAGRYGGEEFAVVIPGVDTASGVAVGERIRAAIAHACGSSEPQVTASIGVASVVPAPGTAPEALIAAADAALYQAKAQGRDRVVPAAHAPSAAR